MRILLLTVYMVTIAAPVFASSGGHGDATHMDKSFYYTLVNFVIMVAALYFILRRSIKAFFRTRATSTKLEMDKVEKLYNEAYRKYEEIEAMHKNADLEGKKLLDALKHEGEMEKQQIIRKAREMAVQIKFDAERVIKQEVFKAKETLKQETVELVTKLAQGKIESAISSDDQKQLNEEFLQALQNPRKAS